MTTTNPATAPRVLFIPPPAPLISDLRKGMNDALATLKSGERGALVLVGTKSGDTVRFNAAVVAKVGEHWAVQSWIGKTWGESVDGGVTIEASW